ncbi:glutamate 5-kinase [Candidatus Gracilibacteria bacterium]|nr:glutamate 5-kinase [Candidatus Gracilibacteria bacterium]
MKRILIKIGTNVITKENGLLNTKVMAQIVAQIVKLKKQGIEVIIVSSGAMGAGRALVTPHSKNKVVQRQILASVGQIKLLEKYSALFAKHKYITAQVLATKEDFRDRMHYLNMQNCFQALLRDKIVPIVNENDVISVSEIMFTDNDELAGLIASMMNVDQLFLLTSVDGILDDKGKVIKNPNDSSKKHITQEKSEMGRGGMSTKLNIAQKLASLGTKTFIVNGQKPDCITNPQGSEFPAKKTSTKQVKKWIAMAEGKAKVHINDCTTKIIKERSISLLPIGITKIEGQFEKGDILSIISDSGQEIGLGKAQYGHKAAKKIIGKKGQKALIHCDYLTLI